MMNQNARALQARKPEDDANANANADADADANANANAEPTAEDFEGWDDPETHAMGVAAFAARYGLTPTATVEAAQTKAPERDPQLSDVDAERLARVRDTLAQWGMTVHPAPTWGWVVRWVGRSLPIVREQACSNMESLEWYVEHIVPACVENLKGDLYEKP
jgi:hypothetical protein